MNEHLIPTERIECRILVIRGQKVILDKDLADLYGVETKVFNQSVKRNHDRFPERFMFQLTEEEFDNLRSQYVTSNYSKRRYLPYAFTEHGKIMAANILNSQKAVNISVLVIDAFIRMRELISTHKELFDKINELESKFGKRDQAINGIIQTLKRLMAPNAINKPKIGFKSEK